MDEDSTFLAIAALVRQRSGLDILGYKRSCVGRRLGVRQRARGCETLVEYEELIRSDPREYRQLVADLTINVTRFFRNPEMFASLEQHVIPKMASRKEERGQQSIRIWSVGCSSGEEPYSVAISTLSTLDRLGVELRVAVHATDVDAAELKTARAGRYPPAAMEGLDRGLVKRFFEWDGEVYEVSRELRGLVYFRGHDLTKDPPLSNFDLILCRNILIYFRREVQQGILESLYRSLNEGGVLVLGKSEALVAETRDLYVTIDMQEKIFARKDGESQTMW